MVEQGTFRDDLFYRLRVVHIHVPPLRERVEDIPVLVSALMRRAADRLGRSVLPVSEAAMARLTACRWPGNVRELENAIERALLMAAGTRIEVADLPDGVGDDGGVTVGDGDDLSIKRHTAALEQLLIRRALAATGGNRTQAARRLDISTKALLYKIRGYGLEDA
jgi:two-component system response regulator AtoC